MVTRALIYIIVMLSIGEDTQGSAERSSPAVLDHCYARLLLSYALPLPEATQQARPAPALAFAPKIVTVV
eukprot:2558194-Pleurochrysis_carterae.AAC.9